MKAKKFKIDTEYDDEREQFEIELRRKSKAELLNNRRPVRNWKKAWSEHTDDYDEHDDFYGKKMSIR